MARDYEKAIDTMEDVAANGRRVWLFDSAFSHKYVFTVVIFRSPNKLFVHCIFNLGENSWRKVARLGPQSIRYLFWLRNSEGFTAIRNMVACILIFRGYWEKLYGLYSYVNLSFLGCDRQQSCGAAVQAELSLSHSGGQGQICQGETSRHKGAS